jgi:prephenate dehydratase
MSSVANFTRFYILSTTLAFEHIPPPKDGPPKHALVRLSSSGMATSVDMHSAPTITQLLIALKLSAIRIDRRPSSYPVPFHDVYLVELQQNLKDGNTEKGLHKVIEPHWISEVKAGLDRVKDIGGEAILLGVW